MSAPDPLAALRIPFVRAFAAGRVASVAGAQMLSTAVGWELYERTGSAWSLGLVGLYEILPVFVWMIPAGNAADRYPRRRIAAAASTLLGVCALGLAAVAWTRGPTPWIYGLLVAVGTSRAFAGPSTGTILPQLLDPDQFANANSWLSATFELASVLGPAIAGGVIAATGGAAVAFLLAAAGQGAFLACLARVPRRDPPRGPASRGWREVFEGFAFVRRTPIFLAAITLDLFAVLLGGAVALLPVFAKDVLHAGPTGLGWLRAAPGLGALTMALLSTRLRPWRRPGRALLATVAGFGVATIGFGLSTSFVLSLGCLFLTGVFDSISVVIRMTLEQMVTPDALRGRVSAIHFVFVGLSNEFGAFESGATAALMGPVASVVLGGVGSLVVVGVVAVVWPFFRRIGPLHTLRPAGESAARGSASE